MPWNLRSLSAFRELEKNKRQLLSLHPWVNTFLSHLILSISPLNVKVVDLICSICQSRSNEVISKLFNHSCHCFKEKKAPCSYKLDISWHDRYHYHLIIFSLRMQSLPDQQQSKQNRIRSLNLRMCKYRYFNYKMVNKNATVQRYILEGGIAL